MKKIIIEDKKMLLTPNERKALISESLKTFRELAKFQQKEVADAIDISAQTYNTYESGRSEPPAEILVRLSMLYEIPVDALIQANVNSRDLFTKRSQIENFQQQIEELKMQLASADPNTQAQISAILEDIEKMNNLMDDVLNKAEPKN